MVTAPVLVLEEKRQAWVRDQTRRELHECFDLWLDSMEEVVTEEPTSLDALARAVFARRQELTAKVTEALVKQHHHQALDQKTASCPQCGCLLPARALVPRTVETLVGEVCLERPYFYCVGCERGFYPLDEALELAERRKQWDIQEAGARLAAEVPFATAQELFTQLTGLTLSVPTTHEVVGELGQGLGVLEVSPTREEIAQRVAGVAQAKKQPPILVLAIDGAHVPTRPEGARGPGKGKKGQRARRARWQGEWKEAKGFRFYLVDKERIVQVLSWHQIQSDEQVGEALRQVKEAGLIPEERVRLCGIGDGAKWIWNQVKQLFPSAVQILDYYHLSERLHKVALAQFYDDPLQEREWVEATKARLFYGYLDWVLLDLEKMQPRDQEAAEEIRKLRSYLEENQGRVKYGALRRKGYPIGSGGIESANKFISHVRLKRSGAWWYVERANVMLALRCAKYNGTFARVFERYRQRAMMGEGVPPS
jgi:Uncharacterised protein family (UPF0236)